MNNGWSSATTTRIFRSGGIGPRHVKPGTASRNGLDGERRADRARAFLDHARPLLRRKSMCGHAAREIEAAAVVVHGQNQAVWCAREAHGHFRCAAMLADVGERLLHQTRELAAR